MKIRARLLFAVCVGLLSVSVVSEMNRRRTQHAADEARQKDVCVAVTDILANRVVEERAVRRIQVPLMYVQPLALSDCAEAVNRVTAVPVSRGAQLVGSALLDPERVDFSMLIGDDRHLAITIGVDGVSGVAGLLRPGNLVDVFASLTTLGGAASPGTARGTAEQMEVRLMYQALPVLAVDQETT